MSKYIYMPFNLEESVNDNTIETQILLDVDSK